MTAAISAITRQVPTRLGRLEIHIVGTGKPLMLWHSMFVDSTSWERLVPLLSDNRRLYLIDAPSSGGSEPLSKAVDIARCAEAAADVIEALRPEIGDGPIDWLGNAWGGHVGIQLAAERPELIRSLVAISAPTHPIAANLRRKIRFLTPLYRLLGGRGVVATAITEALLTDESRTHDARAVDLVLGPMRRANRGGMVRAIGTAILNRSDLSAAAIQIRCPVLFVTTDDRGEWTPEEAQAMVAQMPDAAEVTITGSRVLPMIEQPAALARAVTSFWAGIQERGHGGLPDAAV